MEIYTDERALQAFKEEVLYRKKRYIAKRQHLDALRKKAQLSLKGMENGQDKVTMQNRIDALKASIERLKSEQEPYNFPVTQILPVAYAGRVYNYIMLNAFMKKLNGFTVTITKNKIDTLCIAYEKGTRRGRFELQPLMMDLDYYQKLHLTVVPLVIVDQPEQYVV